ncbi:MAG: sigma-70 family RNA polymerase sigma factor [Muribaculaceae bacterium]
MGDNLLVNQLRQGNQLAFTALYKMYANQAFMLSFKYLCNKALAEDAVQNLFMKIWLKRGEIDDTRPFNHYLFTILKNDLLNILRDSKSEIFVLDDCLEILDFIDNDSQINDIEQEQTEVVKKAYNTLSPQRRKIFSLKMSGKYTNQDIANQLNLSVNTIKFQYSQSLKQIKEFVREYSIMLLM